MGKRPPLPRPPNPCSACRGADCETCQNNPENSIPVKLYTPKGAARAMLVGAILKDWHGWKFFWDNAWPGFRYEDEKGETFPVNDFSGLFEEF